MHKSFALLNAMIACWVILAPSQGIAGPTIDQIKAMGHVRCGTRTDVHGLADLDEQGQSTGFEADFCRAIAAAVLHDKDKVEFTILSVNERIDALKESRIDVLFRTTTWTFGRDLDGIDFVGIIYYDGQGFLVNRSAGLRTILGVKTGSSICVQKDTTTATNLHDYVGKYKLKANVIALETSKAITTFLAGRCDVYTSDRSQLASVRLEAENPNDYVLLPDIISKEPLSAAVKEGDPQWANLVRWVIFATIEAEEKGLNMKNIDTMTASPDPTIQFILGSKADFGRPMGVDKLWAYRVIKQIGNYGEIYDRHLGSKSDLKIPRGINDLWSRGGLLYSPPLR